MKRIISLLLALAMLFTLAACGSGANDPSKSIPAESTPVEVLLWRAIPHCEASRCGQQIKKSAGRQTF